MESMQRNLRMVKGDLVHRAGERGGDGRQPILHEVHTTQRCIVMHNGSGFDLNGASKFKPRADCRA